MLRLIITLIVFTSISIIAFFLDFNLVIFHLYLIKNKMTTYEFIVKKR